MSNTVRKSAFGRTQLFHADADIEFKELQCSSSIIRHGDINHKYHTHNSQRNNNICCWHCCHPYTGDTYHIPRLYDTSENIYHVYGNFCSLNCAKAYLLNLPFFEKEQHMYVFMRMARELYKMDNVIEAPPKESLQMFGGPFSIEEFRAKHHRCVVQHPPFVSYCMIVEEKIVTAQTLQAEQIERSSVRGMKRPEKGKISVSTIEVSDSRLTNKYAQYVEEHKTDESEPVNKKQKSEKKNDNQGLGKFMKT